MLGDSPDRCQWQGQSGNISEDSLYLLVIMVSLRAVLGRSTTADTATSLEEYTSAVLKPLKLTLTDRAGQFFLCY